MADNKHQVILGVEGENALGHALHGTNRGYAIASTGVFTTYATRITRYRSAIRIRSDWFCRLFNKHYPSDNENYERE
jgi:hypothetical protein